MPQVKHVVLLRLKSDTTDAQVDEMMATLAGPPTLSGSPISVGVESPERGSWV